jgi:prepilin-type N-terminal cleavage/methylation domain-containing protein
VPGWHSFPIMKIESSYSIKSFPRPAAFTLIELLVVISIIAILAGLAFPAFNGAINSARKAQARNDVQQIVAAVRAFQSQYGRVPTSADPGADPDNDSADTYNQSDNDSIMRVLMAAESGSGLNSKNIVFLNAKTTKNKKGGVNLDDYIFYDPWGTPYAIKLDNNYNGKIEYYNGGSANIFNIAMAASAGPDKEFGDPYETSGSGKDDICSFK